MVLEYPYDIMNGSDEYQSTSSRGGPPGTVAPSAQPGNLAGWYNTRATPYDNLSEWNWQHPQLQQPTTPQHQNADVVNNAVEYAQQHCRQFQHHSYYNNPCLLQQEKSQYCGSLFMEPAWPQCEMTALKPLSGEITDSKPLSGSAMTPSIDSADQKKQLTSQKDRSPDSPSASSQSSSTQLNVQQKEPYGWMKSREYPTKAGKGNNNFILCSRIFRNSVSLFLK